MVGGYYYSLIIVRIPLKFVQQTKLRIVYMINFTLDRVAALLACRRIIVEAIHREYRFGAECADELCALQESVITLTAL